MTDHDADRQLLAVMKSHGANLTKPAHTIHYLYFKSLEAANSAAEQLQAAGYQNIRTHRAPIKSLWKRWFGPKQFSCIAETHVVPREADVFATTDHMNALAAKFGGQYDGWEASIEK
jgi:hypothetical protein